MNVDPTTLVIAGLVASVPLVVVCLAVLFRGYSIDLHMSRKSRHRKDEDE